MGAVAGTTVGLRFFGDDLEPDELTALLDMAPTVGRRRGEIWKAIRGPEKAGAWLLDAPRREPGDLDDQIGELFARLTPDLRVWTSLCGRYQGDLFCGLFLQESNEGISLEAATTLAIGQRGLLIDFDIYSGDRDP